MLRRTLLLLLALSPPARAQGVPLLRMAEALPLLRAGGLNLYMRHAATDRRQYDTGRLDDRAGQRNLSAAGQAQARAIGEAFRRFGLPVGEVLTSPVFRAWDTAVLAFGQARIEPALIADDYTSRDPREDAGEVSALLASPVARGNRVLVGHVVALGMILGLALEQGEFPEGAIALFRPHGDTWDFLGILTAEALLSAR